MSPPVPVDGAGAGPHPRPVDVAEKALRERPSFSIRLQVYLACLILLAIVLGASALSIHMTSRVDDEVKALEVANRYLFELQQARRFEKNFFLHGKNLDDALESVHEAQRVLRFAGERLLARIGEGRHSDLTAELAQYVSLLQGHAEELAVREHGRKLVSAAEDVVEEEKRELDDLLARTRALEIGSLLVVAIYVALLIFLMDRHLVAPIRRFVHYTTRIAAGDETPIMPARRYRDEFSSLALAINDMIAQLEHRQASLVQSHKLRAVGTLTAGVAHEINNPINNITLTAHVFLEDYDTLSDEEKKDLVTDIAGEAERSRRIVAGLLDFARQSRSEMEPLDMGEVVRAAVALAQNQLNLKGVRADLAVEPNLPPVHGDRQQLDQVFLNLLLNALDVTDKGGRIEVSVGAAGDDYLVVAVTDHGPGIPDHVMRSIFDPFFTTKAKGRGTGLGLSISQGIIATHGGVIEVDTKVGEGSTFRVRLPTQSFPADLRPVVG